MLVQAQINRSNAAAGGSGAQILTSALISVMVTLEGAPADDLAGPPLTNIGNGTTAISLPAGWSLLDGFNVRPGGCGVTVTEFTNQGDGIYDIRIVPYIGNPACKWLSGEYIFAIQLKIQRKAGIRKLILQGGTLAKLIIP
ncbi:MAG TPA: hypothetical protein VEU62_07185 [Bryobacterales bacterium]|nr:hypothetical protein [Bryobacterales bacterium]